MESLTGIRTSATNGSHFQQVINEHDDCFSYDCIITDRVEHPILTTYKSNKTIGVWIPVDEGGILLLPAISEKAHASFIKVLGEEINRLLQIGKSSVAPGWIKDFHLFNEKELCDAKQKKQQQLNSLKEELKVLSNELTDLNYYKKLIYSDGKELEKTVKKSLELIGFKTLPVSTNRADLLFEIGGTRIVFEVKGVSGSAAEKHASQLEKWVNEEHDDDLGLPKGILLSEYI